MTDRFGREINYLRLSLTERCTLKCAYCRAKEGLCPKQSELSTAQFLRIVRVMASLGIKKVRLTGGEPLLRRDLREIISGIHSLPGIAEISLTTNAQQLYGRCSDLKEAGLSRINISIDSLRPERYHSLTGGDLSAVLSGIEEALRVALTPLKLNVVLLRGRNDDEIDDFISMAKEKPVDVRFIELMPFGPGKQLQGVPSSHILKAHPELKPVPPRDPGQPSADYAADGFRGRVGLISPLSQRFCSGCNRVRITSDGTLRPCLGENIEVSLREALEREDDRLLLQTIRRTIYRKPQGHSFCAGGFRPNKGMHRIGG